MASSYTYKVPFNFEMTVQERWYTASDRIRHELNSFSKQTIKNLDGVIFHRETSRRSEKRDE